MCEGEECGLQTREDNDGQRRRCPRSSVVRRLRLDGARQSRLQKRAGTSFSRSFWDRMTIARRSRPGGEKASAVLVPSPSVHRDSVYRRQQNAIGVLRRSCPSHSHRLAPRFTYLRILLRFTMRISSRQLADSRRRLTLGQARQRASGEGALPRQWSPGCTQRLRASP